MLSIKNLSVQYETKLAVNDVSLDVSDSKITGLIGPNGAGKSSLIKACVGLIDEYSGSIKYNGLDNRKNRHKVKQICGYAPEDTVLLPYLKGNEFLELICKLRQVADVKQDMEAILDRMDLKESADDLIINYSHGMRKKISIAATLLGQPDFLIFDEALNGLDSITLFYLKNHLSELAAQGKTILITSHILPLILDWCDPVIIINEGRIIKSFSQAEIKNITRESSFEEIFVNLIKNPE
jgi:ABC-2 type transport system ATP-binding protein